MARDRSSKSGTCRICGFEGKLSFEHVPPKAAFNNHPLVLAGIHELLGRDLDEIRGRTHQKGAGAYTLCERCNNRTGHWYGEAYVEWARQALMIVRATGGQATLYYNYWLRPLRALKQVICMFLSFFRTYPHLRGSFSHELSPPRGRVSHELSPPLRG